MTTILKQESIAFQNIYNSNVTSDLFDRKITNNSDIFLENWVWYFYRYNTWSSFPHSNYSSRDLSANNLLNSNTILDIRDGKIVFIREFEKIRLIDDTIISWVTDKYSFLREVKDDKRFLSNNTDEYFKQLKSDTIQLIWKEKKSEKKIQKIYNFVLDNISYTQNLDLEDKKIFSGIESYKNRDGVCEGYSKLMVYMLWFAWISDYEAIRWYVIDAVDFPEIGHAWVRIGDKYYDPTFDDPIWNEQTRTPDKYIYYNLPQDLFYTNRYHYDDLPEFLETRTMEFRNNYIEKKLALLVDKYKSQNYLLLKPFVFKENIWLAYNDTINIDDLKNNMSYYEIINDRLTQNGSAITWGWTQFSYFQITTDNIPTILKQIDYNIDEYFLIKLEDGSYGIGYGLR